MLKGKNGETCLWTPEEQLVTKPTQNPKPTQNMDHDQERGDLCHPDIPGRLQEFREDLVDDRLRAHLATQWIQSYPCKTKTSQETQRSLQKFLEPIRKPKVIDTVNSLEFGRLWRSFLESLYVDTTQIRNKWDCWESSAQSVIEGTSAVLLQSGLDEKWWADSMECYSYLRNIQDLLSDGKTPYERRFGEQFKGPIIPFGSLVEYYPICAKDQSRIYQFGKKWKEVLPGLLLGYVWYAGWIWKGDIMVAHFEELETMNASEIYSKRLNAKEVIFHQEGEFIFPAADGRIKLSGGDQELRTPTLIRDRPIRGESQRDFLGESEGSHPPPPQDSLPDVGEAINDFWSMSGNFMYRHHVEPRVKHYSPREESFPIPLKYIDVSRTTHTNLDVKQEKRVDDYWSIGGSRDLSDSWTDFTQFTLLDKKHPDGYVWSLKEKQNGQMKNQNSIMPEDYKEFVSLTLRTRNSKRPFRKLERNWKHRRLQPCFARHARKTNMGRPVARLMILSQNLCILEASESTRLRMEESLPYYHEDHIAGKGDNSLQHYNFVHNFTPVLQAMKIPAATAAVDQAWEKLEKIPAWDLTKVSSKSVVIDEARTMGAKVHVASLMEICHLKNAELETKHQEHKLRVVFRGHIVEDDSGSYAVFTEQGSSASQMTAATKVMDIICRLPGCRGQAADAVSSYTQEKWKVLQNYWKFQNRNVQTIGFVYHDTNGQNHGPVWKTQSSRLSENCTVILWQDCYGKGNLRKSFWSAVARRFPIGNAYSYTVKKGYSYLCMWMTLIRCGRYLTKKLIWENQHLSLIMYIWECTQRQCDISKDIVDKHRILFESRISAGASEKSPCSNNLRFSSCSHDMEGHAKTCAEGYCELANKTTQQLHKLSIPCIDDHHFK